VDVRVWGLVDDRLIELRVEPLSGEDAMRILGLSDKRARTTADRVRAALINSGLVQEAPPLTIRLEPPVLAGTTSDLDIAIALAALARVGQLGAGLRWILATGRLGLDGTVHARKLAERTSLADVVGSLCHTPVVGFEHMFEREKR
jgi:predicted ATPase with chaperone activity